MSSLEVCSVSLRFKPLLSGPLISQLLSYCLLVNFDSSFFFVTPLLDEKLSEGRTPCSSHEAWHRTEFV